MPRTKLAGVAEALTAETVAVSWEGSSCTPEALTITWMLGGVPARVTGSCGWNSMFWPTITS